MTVSVNNLKPPLFFRNRRPGNRAVTDYSPKEARSLFWGGERELTFFWQIVNGIIHTPRKPVPIVIGIDGSPGTGKSYFARMFANYLNLRGAREFGEPCFAQVFQMDELLTGQHKKLQAEPDISHCNPEFWYNLDRLPQILQALIGCPPLQEVTIDGLYNRNAFDGQQKFIFSPTGYNFILLEGCYALHQNHGDLLDLGIYLWRRGKSYRTFFFRSLARSALAEQEENPALVNNLYQLIIQTYIQYLKSSLAFKKLAWLLHTEELGPDIKVPSWLLRPEELDNRERLDLKELQQQEEKAVLFRETIPGDLTLAKDGLLSNLV